MRRSQVQRQQPWRKGRALQAHLRHVRQPVQDSEDPLKVITNGAVGHPIVVHDLDATELVIGGIYFPPEDLEQEKRHWS